MRVWVIKTFKFKSDVKRKVLRGPYRRWSIGSLPSCVSYTAEGGAEIRNSALIKILHENLIETILRPFRSCLRSANDVDVRESSGDGVGGGDGGGRGGADDDEGNGGGGSSGNDDGDGHKDRLRRGF